MLDFIPLYNKPFDFKVFKNFLGHSQIDYIFKNLQNIPYDNAKLVGQSQSNARKSQIKWLHFNQTWNFLYESISHLIHETNSDYWRFDLKNIREPFQYTEYHASENGKYDWHVDLADQACSHRKVSVTIQLSHPDEYEGGDLEIFEYNGNNSSDIPYKKVDRGLGTAVIFPSYILHRVTPVTKGVRKSLVLWVGGKPFK